MPEIPGPQPTVDLCPPEQRLKQPRTRPQRRIFSTKEHASRLPNAKKNRVISPIEIPPALRATGAPPAPRGAKDVGKKLTGRVMGKTPPAPRILSNWL